MRTLRSLRRIAREQWIGYAAAVLGVALVNGVIGLLVQRVTISNISMLNLIVVVAVARTFGIRPAVASSVAAYVIFDWFFVEPLNSLGGADPAEWLELVLFLATAVVTGQLAAGQRQRARQAERREREAVVLYGVVRLVGDLDLDQALIEVTELLRHELQLAAVAIELPNVDGSPMRATAGEVSALPEPFAFSAEQGQTAGEEIIAPPSPHRMPADRSITVVHPTSIGSPHSTSWGDLFAVPVISQDRRVGVLILSRAIDAPESDDSFSRMLLAVAAQLGHAIERQRLRREATEAEILRRSDQVKSTLLNAVSHDLRTPLASITASGESLLEKDVEWTEQDRDEFARAIVREARRLNRLVSNLLDLSRIEMGGLRPEMDWYPLGALVNDVLGRLRPITAHHSVVVDVEKDLPPVHLDYVEIDQVLSNLVENAVKYSPPETEIQISARQEEGVIRVEVADRGPGIEPEAMALLFRPFHRLDGIGQQPKGTGLGLAITKGLVEAHGGQIAVGIRQGGGASFVFTLPVSPHGRTLPIVREGTA